MEQPTDAPLPTSTDAPQSRRSSQRRLIRAVVLTDGVVIVCFRKNTHETRTLVLDNSGHTYSYIGSDGSPQRHITPLARSSQRRMLIDAVRLRNQFLAHTDDASLTPYVDFHLLSRNDGGVSTIPVMPRERISNTDVPLRVRWPTGKFRTDTLFDDAAQCFELRSIEGNARVCLNASGTLADAYFLVEARISRDRLSDQDDQGSGYCIYSGQHILFANYATVRQTFAPARTPPCFAYGVAVLQHARRAHEARRRTFVVSDDCDAQSSARSHNLPWNAAFHTWPPFTALSSQRGSTVETCSLSLEDALRVASRPSRQLYARVAVEVREDATFFVDQRSGSAVPSVVVQLANRSAVVECIGSFFRWYGDGDMHAQQFVAETVPPPSVLSSKRTPASDGTSLQPLCYHAMELVKWRHIAASASTAAIAAASATPPPQPLSTDVVKSATNKLGRFRAFADGRVRVVFADRTILEVDAARECCAFTLSDGTTRDASIAALSAELLQYVEPALEFRDWAITTPAEQLACRELRHSRRAVADHELRKIGVRIGLNGRLEVAPTYYDTRVRGDDNNRDGYDVHHSSLSLQQLQDATQRHIASVDALLHAAPPQP